MKTSNILKRQSIFRYQPPFSFRRIWLPADQVFPSRVHIRAILQHTDRLSSLQNNRINIYMEYSLSSWDQVAKLHNTSTKMYPPVLFLLLIHLFQIRLVLNVLELSIFPTKIPADSTSTTPGFHIFY